MNHYLDLHLLPDPEFSAAQLMSALFAKLHRALVAQPALHIGISLPQARAGQPPADQQPGAQPYLGQHLRLHGQADALAALMALPWLSGMRDHVNPGPIVPAPANAPHRLVRRVQADSNPERLRRRLCKRHTLSEEEARQRIPNRAARHLDLPYVQLRSQSTGQHFLLFIDQGDNLPEPRPGGFNCYGLSQGGSVPWF